MNINGTELLVIAIVFLLIFSPKELPKMGKTLGRAMREFRRVSQEITSQFSLEDQGKNKEKGYES